ncbi:MAG: 2-amino-4-hydroxy-6-hydroxymethyldihydropteridine diphosphokinase [Bacteroidia bacterium]|nr:2-amino-4-hydroxy-6-hydroxymethyldihydropteridine diphosphokinase [Bacteroidia bacterium]
MRYLVLAGGNIGDTQQLIREAFSQMEQLGTIIRRSAFYRSEAWGFESDQSFINAAVLLESALDPENLLQELLRLEKTAGRVRSGNAGYASRTLDLDILFAGNLVYSSKDLEVPHPRMHIRKFALMPAVEILPDLMHPVFKKKLGDLLHECPDTSAVERLPAAY